MCIRDRHSRARASRRKYLWRVERWQFQRRGDSQVGLTDPTVRIDLDIGRPLAHVLSAASTLSSRAVPSRQPPHALPARSLDERNVMLSCMFGLSARSFGQETVFVSSLYSKEWMCNVSPFHTRYDTHTMLNTQVQSAHSVEGAECADSAKTEG